MASPERTFKAGDLEPPIEVVLYQDGTRDPIDLRNAVRVEFHARRDTPDKWISGARANTGKRFGGPAVVVKRITESGDPDRGKIRYLLLAGDTDLPGEYRAVAKIFWPGSGSDRPQTVPSDGYLEITIEQNVN